jgi:hypothetical protein
MASHISFDLGIWMKISWSRLPGFQRNAVNRGLRKSTPGALQLAGDGETVSFTICNSADCD